MIYFCLLLITVTFAGFSMIFYVCLINQGYLSTFMHVLWNIIRFFNFSFFFYGAAYGMCYLALRDAVSYVMYVFGNDNLSLNNNSFLIPENEGKEFLNFCLIGINNNFKTKINDILTSSLEDYFKSCSKFETIIKEYKILPERIENEKNLKNLVSSRKSMIDFIEEKISSLCSNKKFSEISIR